MWLDLILNAGTRHYLDKPAVLNIALVVPYLYQTPIASEISSKSVSNIYKEERL